MTAATEQRSMESIILTCLLEKSEYCKQVIPFLHQDYFADDSDRILFDEMKSYVDKFNTPPSKVAIEVSLQARSDLTEPRFKKALGKLKELSLPEEVDYVWLVQNTEKFCQDRALTNAIFRSIDILDNEKRQKKSKESRSAIPDILKEALAVSFDTRIGHDWTTEYADRFAAYTAKEYRIPFDLEIFNEITNGGTPKKTLNIVMATTNAGKTLFMCHHAAFCLRMGLNVLYITCEMAEEKIAQRIDANMLKTAVNDIEKMAPEAFGKRIESLVSKTNGRLIIKEYPTGTPNVNHFRVLLKELKLKKSFAPDIIFVDYLNICASSRLNADQAANTYVYVKAIAEELRGLAVEYDLPIWSATQSNRSGHSNSDVDLTNTSESWGLPGTADFFFCMIRTEEFDEDNTVLIKQLKNRYDDLTKCRRFMLGIDRPKMTLYDLDSNQATEDLVESKIRKSTHPAMSSEREELEIEKPAEEIRRLSFKPSSKFDKPKLSKFEGYS